MKPPPRVTFASMHDLNVLGPENATTDIGRRPTGSTAPATARNGPARPLAEYAVMAKRDDAMAATYRSGDYTMKQIAEHFSVHYATVSRAIRRQDG